MRCSSARRRPRPTCSTPSSPRRSAAWPRAIWRPRPPSTGRRSGGSTSWPRRTRWASTRRRSWRESSRRSSTTRARASSRPSGRLENARAPGTVAPRGTLRANLACAGRSALSIHPADYLVHFSNVLLLVSYSVRDILWLRWFAVAAALTNIPYFLVQGTVLWPPVVWALVFTAINLFQITRIYLERRPVVLSDDEQKLYDLAFRSLRPREFVSLALVGEWKSADAGERVLAEGRAVSSICIAIAGAARVHRHGHDVGVIEPGRLIGSALALTGDPSPVDATFTS